MDHGSQIFRTSRTSHSSADETSQFDIIVATKTIGTITMAKKLLQELDKLQRVPLFLV
jgi:hypothetical protein